MTDNEFIRALRAVAKKYEGKPVATFEINISAMATDAADRIERLCDEINRQKAENERLISRVSVLAEIEKDYALKYGNDFDVGIVKKQIQAEAIKEFAERLKEVDDYVSPLDIDYLVKEMTEETT